jgi:hypothetical protein
VSFQECCVLSCQLATWRLQVREIQLDTLTGLSWLKFPFFRNSCFQQEFFCRFQHYKLSMSEILSIINLKRQTSWKTTFRMKNQVKLKFWKDTRLKSRSGSFCSPDLKSKTWFSFNSLNLMFLFATLYDNS